jgi:hypothetical protein
MRKHNPRHLHIRIPDISDPRLAEEMVNMRIPSVWRALWCLIFLAGFVVVGVLYMLDWRGEGLRALRSGVAEVDNGAWESGKGDAGESDDSSHAYGVEEVELSGGVHPISFLMNHAEENFQTLLATETSSLHIAASAYRKTRRRHPPPGFDAWHAYAVESSAVIIEAFWDQIYEDLKPFWSIDPVTLRKQTHVFTPKISIRDGKVEGSTNNAYEKLDIWVDMLRTLAKHPGVKLPDLDIPVNVNDEPAMLVPWEVLDTAVSMARPFLLESGDVVSDFASLEDVKELTANFTFDPEWKGPRLTHPASQLGPRPFWSLVRPACNPGSRVRNEHVFNDIWDPEGGRSEEHEATALLPTEPPEGSLRGYVKSYGDAVDVCRQPHLQGLHSAFVAPNAMSVTQNLFPLFGDSKLAMSGEILIPGAKEWNLSSSVSERQNIPWGERANKLFWRGPATQSRDSARYWRRFQLERLVSMLNATHVEIAEASVHSGNESTVGVGYASNFRLLPANEYRLKSQMQGQLAEWVNGWADASFMDLRCDTETEKGCVYFNEYFKVDSGGTVGQDVDAKYAAVVDSDDGSDLVQNLLDGKVIVRASIYRKWYDNRLVPWLHFIPMDNTFVDLYGIMEYFLGTSVSEEAKLFSHAVGEVRKHEHHFKTPGTEHEKDLGPVIAEHGSQVGNEPHGFEHARRAMPKRADDGHDEAARKIADASKQWARKVLRREDTLVYVYRLLLEYARILDDRRERLGWVDDLKDE